MELQWCRFQGGGNPGLEAALAFSMLQHSARTGRAMLVFDSPSKVVSFSRLDQLSPGFNEAVKRSRERGWGAVSRISGGRAVAASPGCLRILFSTPHPPGDIAVKSRFESILTPLQRAFGGLGVEVETGETEGEWCPGEFSLKLKSGGKITGLGQRSTPAAHHICAICTLSGASELSGVLGSVYEALGQKFDPLSLAEAPMVSAGELQNGFLQQIAAEWQLQEGPLPPSVLQQARGLSESYLLS